MKRTILTLTILAILVLLLSQDVAACSCGPQHPQNILCGNHFGKSK